MIQDIAPHVLCNAYQPKPPKQDSYALCFCGREVLVAGEAHALSFPRFSDLEGKCEDLYEAYTYLFSIDDACFYLVEIPAAEAPPGFRWESTQLFRTASPRHLAFAGITAFQLYNWYCSHRFCGRCGQPARRDDKERMLRCDSCGNMEYPKISPAVIVAVTHGNRILMSKYANREYKSYALLAGFAEIGETIEETVKREVMEEVGLNVKNLQYYKSQPWPFTDTLLLGFFVELAGDVEAVRLDREELALAEWFDRAHIPPVESLISLTSEMIEKFRRDGFPQR